MGASHSNPINSEALETARDDDFPLATSAPTREPSPAPTLSPTSYAPTASRAPSVNPTPIHRTTPPTCVVNGSCPVPTPVMTYAPSVSELAWDQKTNKSDFSVSLFKRTHASADARGDAAFLARFFGVNVTINETFTDAGGACARRLGLAVMPSFELHYFESEVTPEGPLPVADWVAYFRKLHAGFSRARATAWDAYMWNSMTFYAPDLTPFVRGLRGAGVPVFGARYNHSFEDCDGASIACRDVLVYSASVVVPGTGQLFEVVSEHLDGPLRGAFDEWPDAACPDAMAVTQPVKTMRALWDAAGGRMADGRGGDAGDGLPSLLAVKMSFAGSPGELTQFVKVAAGAEQTVDVAADDDGYCAYATTALGGQVDVRAVEAPSARSGARSVAMWTGYVRAMHERWTGFDVGWDRFLDGHLGLEISGGTALDELVGPLRALNVSFRAHAGAAGMTGEAVSTGSLWTGGVGAQGFELHGSFDWSTLSAVGTTGMDYCGTPSAAGAPRRPQPRRSRAKEQLP